MKLLEGLKQKSRHKKPLSEIECDDDFYPLGWTATYRDDNSIVYGSRKFQESLFLSPRPGELSVVAQKQSNDKCQRDHGTFKRKSPFYEKDSFTARRILNDKVSLQFADDRKEKSCLESHDAIENLEGLNQKSERLLCEEIKQLE